MGFDVIEGIPALFEHPVTFVYIGALTALLCIFQKCVIQSTLTTASLKARSYFSTVTQVERIHWHIVFKTPIFGLKLPKRQLYDVYMLLLINRIRHNIKIVFWLRKILSKIRNFWSWRAQWNNVLCDIFEKI